MNIFSASDCLPVSLVFWQPFPSKRRVRFRSNGRRHRLAPAFHSLWGDNQLCGRLCPRNRTSGTHRFLFHPHGCGDGYQPYLCRKIRGPRIHHPDYFVWFLCSHCGILPALLLLYGHCLQRSMVFFHILPRTLHAGHRLRCDVPGLQHTVCQPRP